MYKSSIQYGYALKEITVDPMVSRTKQMDEEIEIRKN